MFMEGRWQVINYTLDKAFHETKTSIREDYVNKRCIAVGDMDGVRVGLCSGAGSIRQQRHFA